MILRLMNLQDVIITQSPQLVLEYTLSVVLRAVPITWVLEKCMMPRIHHYSIVHKSFAALKILCLPPMYPQPPATTNLSLVSIVVSFP